MAFDAVRMDRSSTQPCDDVHSCGFKLLHSGHMDPRMTISLMSTSFGVSYCGTYRRNANSMSDASEDDTPSFRPSPQRSSWQRFFFLLHAGRLWEAARKSATEQSRTVMHSPGLPSDVAAFPTSRRAAALWICVRRPARRWAIR